MTWTAAKHIYQNNVYWDMGYSSTVQLPDFRIVSAYYTNGGKASGAPGGIDMTIQRAIFYENYF